MRKEPKSVRGEPPRAYDRASGEYRPVERYGGAADFAAAARYRADSRRRHRRHVLVFFYLFLFLLVLSAAAVLSLTVLFKISDIYVTGSSRYPKQQIVAESGIKNGDNLFLAKTDAAARKISEKFPYLGTVAVKRRFPAKIEINVREDTVYGAAAFGKKYVVVGKNGNALEIADRLPRGCAELKGLAVKSAQTGKKIEYRDSGTAGVVKTVMEALTKSGITNISSVDFSESYRILAVYDGRIVINLGIPSDLDYKLKFVKTLLAGNLKSTDRGTLNMSVASETDKAYFDPGNGPPASASAGG